MTPQIVNELRRENAALRAEVARLKRMEAWSWGVACDRIRVLEAGLRSLPARGINKMVERILTTPVKLLAGSPQEPT